MFHWGLIISRFYDCEMEPQAAEYLNYLYQSTNPQMAMWITEATVQWLSVKI